MKTIAPDILATLTTNGAFCVDVYPECPFGTEIQRRIPPHRLVVEPLVAKASEMRIYGHDQNDVFSDDIFALGKRKRGYVEVDLTQEVVKAHERIWNVGAWRRGGIVLAVILTDQELAEILRWCSNPNVMTSLYQIRKGTPASAIRYAQSVAVDGSLGFSFSASNGIQWMDIFPPANDLLRVFEMAIEVCRPFTRFVSHNPGANEIVVDRPPYTDMI